MSQAGRGGNSDSSHHLRDPTNQGQQGDGEAQGCPAWEARAGVTEGPEDRLGAVWRLGCSFSHSVRLSSFRHPPVWSTPSLTELPALGPGDAETDAETSRGSRPGVGRRDW